MLQLVFERIWLDEGRVVAVRPKHAFAPFLQRRARESAGKAMCKERERRVSLPPRVVVGCPFGASWRSRSVRFASPKTCKCRSFRERLKGFEPSTFCMASRIRAASPVQKHPANKPFSRRSDTPRSPAVTAKLRGFPHETGPTLCRRRCTFAVLEVRGAAQQHSGRRAMRPARRRSLGLRAADS
jgi:hypothetical protein